MSTARLRQDDDEFEVVSVHQQGRLITSKDPGVELLPPQFKRFEIKDSGQRQQFESGMVRDVVGEKTEYERVLEGPMFERWAEHLTKGATKYPDRAPGRANWTLASGIRELLRFKGSALRHFIRWFFGLTDEDHAAAVFFNINGAEFVKERLGLRSVGMADIEAHEAGKTSPPASGAPAEELVREIEQRVARERLRDAYRPVGERTE